MIICPDLANALKNGKLMPSYLIVDADILKLDLMARNFAKNFNAADVFYLKKPEDKTVITVEATENFVSQSSLAGIGAQKLLIVSDAADLNIASQNKLLKTIEDSRGQNVFLFLASSDANILPTIKSRCVRLNLPPLSFAEIKSEFPYFPETFSDGTLTTAQLFIQTPNAKEIYERAEKLLNAESLDRALQYIAYLNKKENQPLALVALNHFAKTQPVLSALAKINRNINANCNKTNAFDLLILALF
ncbi:MAG: hypothetical protein LBM01_02825 [Christensenellaceae bacterium]|jgi:DNA polymerase III delta prime subunit|nr:hypothetical protein [Christensenellaceae bacterium]